MAREDEDDVVTLGITDGGGDEDTTKPEGEEVEEGDGEETTEDRGDDVDGDDPDILAELAAQVTDPAEPAAKKPDAPSVPYPRFKEVNDEVKELRDRLARLEGRTEAAPAAKTEEKKSEPVDLDKLEGAYMKAVLEGDEEGARKTRAQIREAEMAEAEKRAMAKIEAREAEREAKEAERAQAAALTQLKNVAEAAIKKYPYLDIASDKADKVAIEEVKDWRDLYISRGHPPAVALAKAVERVVKAKVPAKTAAADDEKPAPTRKAAAVERNAGVEKRIPATPGASTGGGGARINVATLTEAEFNQLPESEKKKLRGDVA